MTITAIAAPTTLRPLAYQHRARLLCTTCFGCLDIRPRPYGGAAIPIPAPTPAGWPWRVACAPSAAPSCPYQACSGSAS